MATEEFCPICHCAMIEEHKIKYIDYYCNNEHHCYVKRLRDNKLLMHKIRLLDSNGEKLYLKVSLIDSYSEVWKHTNNTFRNRINVIVNVDFNDIESIKNKIKTYIVFS